MKLKNRLSLFSVIIFSILMFFLCVGTYISYYRQIEKREFKTLGSKTLLAAVFYLEKDETTLQEHEFIKSQLQKSISRKDVLIIDDKNQKFNGEMDYNGDISSQFLSDIRRTKQSFTSNDTYFYDGIFYKDNQGDFVVIARVSKDDFIAQMNTLMRILLVVFLLSIIFVYFFSRYLGYIAYQPINSVIRQLKSRSEKNFNEPIFLEKSYAEIQDLAKEYNYFVNELNQTFQIQKNFTDYVSHELRTPIAAIYGTLEVTLSKERENAYYLEMFSKVKNYTEDLEQTLDQMMLLSGAKRELDFKKVRIDEVLFDITEVLTSLYKSEINLNIAVENFEILIVNGDYKLLQLAFKNIIENAIKYSEKAPVNILLENINNHLQVKITDTGIGIPKADLPKITQNFYRAENSKSFKGKGIGLSLAQIIFNLHHANITVTSENHETCVKVLF